MICSYSKSSNFFRTSKNGLNSDYFAKNAHKIAKSKYFPDIKLKVKFDEIDLEQLLKSLGWLNIRQLTDFDTASLMFKISREKMPKQTQELFTKCETIHQYNARSVNSGNLILPKMRTLKGQTSFAF